MLRLVAALVFLSTVAFSQPFTGPFTVTELTTMATISQPHLTLRNADTADVFYQIADTVFHATVLLQNGQVVAGPEALTTHGSGWTRWLADVTMTSSRWVALVYDTTSAINQTVIYTGGDAADTGRVIDSGNNWCDNSPWTYASRHVSPVLAPRDSGYAAAWIDYWDVRTPQQQEGGISVSGEDYLWSGEVAQTLNYFQGPRDRLMIRSISPDSLIALGSDPSLFLLLPHEMVQPPPTPLDCPANVVNFLRTRAAHTLVLCASDRARLYEVVGQSAQARATTEGLPLASASHPDFGMAWLAGGIGDWYLFRADTMGAISSLPGLLAEPQAGYLISEAALAMTGNGLIAALWVEYSPLDSSTVSLHLASLGWDTPLQSSDRHSSLHPSAFSLSSSPNPFNSEAQIEYSLPQAQKIVLSVYNLLGQKVATLFDGMQAAGTHTQSWSPAGAGGIYFAVLKSGQTTRTLKLAYLK
ncbi:MAG TPA: T9SS type A sorting domain-containing protein [bacterium]|jgi:hypothetical protein